MSKYIKKIPLDKIKKIEIYLNTKKKSLATIVKETGADYAINGGFFNSNWTACPILKKDGAMIASASYGQWGYGWNNGKDIHMTSDVTSVANFISCVELMDPWAGANTKLSYSASAVGGTRGRTAMGMTDNELVLYCSGDGTSDAKTPEKLRDELAAFGCKTAIMFDGGGSSQCDMAGSTIKSSRIVQNLILVYLEGNTSTKADYREELVNKAISQLGVSGPIGDDKYISWYNQATGSSFAMNVSWCAIFVSWCVRQVGVPESGLPNYASCTWARGKAKELGTWRNRSAYVPKRGDVIIFDWNVDGIDNHTGIVEKVDSHYVYTVEGNSNDAVRRKIYARTYSGIDGYIEWDNPSASKVDTTIQACQDVLKEHFGLTINVDGTWGPESKICLIKAIQKSINKDYKGKLTVDGSFGPATITAFPDVASVTKNDLAYCIQIALIINGYTSLVIDGSFGPAARSATVEFQKKAKLTANGIFGKNTMANALSRMTGPTTQLTPTENPTETPAESEKPVEPEKPTEQEKPSGGETTPTETKKPTQVAQEALNAMFGAGIEVDGSFGPASKKALIVAIQKSINKDYKKKLTVDGSFGPSTKSACPDIKAVTKNDVATCVQIALNAKGYATEIDGSYGPACAELIKKFQTKKKINADGICGPTTFSYLIK